MTALNFPSNPAINDTYTASGRTWKFNGVSWVSLYSSPESVSSFNTRTGAVVLGSDDVTTALGFTPYNSTNTSGYTSNLGTVTSVAGTGTVNGLTLSGTVTSAGSLTFGGTLDLSSPPPIGSTTPAASTFTTLTATGQVSLGGAAGSEGFRAYVPTTTGTWLSTQTTSGATYLGTEGVSLPLVFNTNNNIFSVRTVTLGGVSNEQFRVSHTSGATNYVGITGSVAGQPRIQALGGSAALALSGNGANGLTFWSNSFATQQFAISHTATAVNYLQVTGAATNTAASISSQGSDTSVSLVMQAKGASGTIGFGNTNGLNNHAFRVSTGTAINTGNLILVTGSAAGASPSISAISGTSGSDTNIDLTLTPKGTGKVIASSPIQIDTHLVIDAVTLTTTVTTANQVLTALDAVIYRAAKFLICAVDVTSGKYHTTEILAIHNNTTANSTEYGSVNIGGVCATFDVDYSANTIRLLTTPASANSTVFTVAVQLLK